MASLIDLRGGVRTGPPATEETWTPEVARFIARQKSKHRPGLTRARCIGDSWAAGNGASTGAKSCYQLLKAALGAQMRFSNYGFAGRPIHALHQAILGDGADAAKQSLTQVERDDIAFGVLGLNDAKGTNWNAQSTGGCGTEPNNFAQLQARAMGLAAWMCIPEANKVRMHTLTNSGPNPGVTFSGAWTHTGFNNFDNFSFTSTTAGTATFDVPRGDLLVIWTGTDSAAAGVCAVTVDGVVYDGWSSLAAYDAWAPSCYFLRLPTNKPHRVVLTLSTPGLMMVDTVACVDTSTDFGASFLYSGPCHLLDVAGPPAQGWAAGATANSAVANGVPALQGRGLANGGCDAFAGAIDRGMAQLFDMGFNVVGTHARVGFNPYTHINPADSLHPNDLGHAHLYSAFSAPLLQII